MDSGIGSVLYQLFQSGCFTDRYYNLQCSWHFRSRMYRYRQGRRYGEWNSSGDCRRCLGHLCRRQYDPYGEWGEQLYLEPCHGPFCHDGRNGHGESFCYDNLYCSRHQRHRLLGHHDSHGYS